MTSALTDSYRRQLIAEIQAVDPSYVFQSFGSQQTLAGQMNQLNDLRLDRGRVFYQVRGDARPLQVETLRFLQRTVDVAYVEGLQRLSEGRLDIRLSPREALGNFIDLQARRKLSQLYSQLGVTTGPGSNIRIVGREYDTSGSDATYRIPDSRVANVAFDVTLTRKRQNTPQIQGFFNADFKPDLSVIVRPSQMGADSTYVITGRRN